MSWDVTIKPNFRGLEDLVKFKRSDMKRIGLKGRKLMQDRVKKGLDIHDKPLKEYSKEYANYKRRLGKNPNIVNMEDSGDMLKLKEDVISNTEAEISVVNHKKIGYYHQTGTAKGGKVREWFGFTQQSKDILLSEIQKIVDKQIRKLR